MKIPKVSVAPPYNKRCLFRLLRKYFPRPSVTTMKKAALHLYPLIKKTDGNLKNKLYIANLLQLQAAQHTLVLQYDSYHRLQ